MSIKQTQRHVTLHYPGFGTDSVKTANWSRERCFQQLRSWRNMHVGSGAYKEVAYNFYALPTGDFVDGRGLRQNGANGYSAANRAGLSIQVLIGDNEDLTPGHVRAVNDCLAYIAKHHPQAVGTLYGHQHWVSTRCPGPRVMSALRAGRFGAGKSIAVSGPGATVPRPSTPAKSDGLSDGLADVDKAQGWLKALGYDVGPVDGKFGTQTQTATRVFQEAVGITPADGRPGPATRKELEDMANKIDTVIEQNKQNQWRLDNIKRQVDAIEKSVSAFGAQNQWRIDNVKRQVDKVESTVNAPKGN